MVLPDAEKSDDRPRGARGARERWRRRGVTLGVLGLLAAQTFEMVTGREHWPFSPYPMFSKIEEPTTLTRLRLLGLTPAGDTFELVRDAWLAPFDPVRLRIALTNLDRAGDADRLRTATADVARRYAARRAAGAHAGPPLTELRLVADTWPLVAGAANRDRPAERRVRVRVRVIQRLTGGES